MIFVIPGDILMVLGITAKERSLFIIQSSHYNTVIIITLKVKFDPLKVTQTSIKQMTIYYIAGNFRKINNKLTDIFQRARKPTGQCFPHLNTTQRLPQISVFIMQWRL